jgi:hypothetical protein
MEIEVEGGAPRFLRAGPFDLRVEEGRSVVSWDAERQRLEMEVTRGWISVGGAHLPSERLRLRGPRRLNIEVDPPRTIISELDVSTEPVVAADPPARPARKLVTRRAAQPDWRSLFEAGEYAASYALAEAQGFDGLVARAKVDELEVLADLARLSRAPAQARSVLLQIRERHPGGRASARAAFDLGRLASDADKSRAWFDTYLMEQPRGSFAQDARGRILRSLAGGRDTAKRRRAARDYLEHHPKGPDAEHARALLEP